MKSKTPWVVAGGAPGEVAYCERCGQGLTLNMPQPIPIFVAASNAFVKMHAKCMPGSYFPKPPVTPQEWVAGRDTGTSSLTIYHVMTGNPSHHRDYDIPYDPDDFGRCYRLLKIFPQWRSRLSEVAARFPEWKQLIANWDELTSLYEEEAPAGIAPKLYARMKQLRPAEKR